MACTRRLFLDTRWLLPSPVVPLSPVRVAIWVSRLPMGVLSGRLENEKADCQAKTLTPADKGVGPLPMTDRQAAAYTA